MAKKPDAIFVVMEGDKIQATVETLKDAEFNAWDGCEIFEVANVYSVTSELKVTKTQLKDHL